MRPGWVKCDVGPVTQCGRLAFRALRRSVCQIADSGGRGDRDGCSGWRAVCCVPARVTLKRGLRGVAGTTGKG